MIQIANWVSEDEVVAALNLEPPRPAAYARFVETYWSGCNPDSPPDQATEVVSVLREWAEQEARMDRALFTSNYLARAPSFEPPASHPPQGWQLPKTIPTKLSRSIGAALMSARLRTLVDEWLETGQERDGSECPARRNLHRAACGWVAVSEFLAASPPSLAPATDGSGFILTIAEPNWRRPWANHFFAAQKVMADRLFAASMLSDWQQRLGKCRYPTCGRYFVAKLRPSYQHGTFCSRAHRANASAESLTKARRDRTKRELIESAARWLAARRRTSDWQDDPQLKLRLTEAIAKQAARNWQRGAARETVGVKWVTRNRVAIERRRVELS